MKEQYPGIKRIIAQDYHRNGIGGTGTIVTIFEPAEAEGSIGPFIAMTITSERVGDFVPSEYQIRYHGSYEKAETEMRLRDFAANTYAVELTRAMNGDIEFAGGNSWRAGDYWGPGIAAAWRERCMNPTEEWAIPHDPFAPMEMLGDLESERDRYELSEAREQRISLRHRIDELQSAIDLLDDRIAIFEQRKRDKAIASTK